MDSARLQLESFAKLSLEDNDSDEDQGSYVMRDKGLNNYKGVIDEVRRLQNEAWTPLIIEQEMREQDAPAKSDLPTQFTGKRRKRKGKKSKLQVMHVERQPPNPKWADKCMYAELLEMSEDMPWDSDGIPADIETGWVAVAPVPVGKRCLVVTSMPSGTNATGASAEQIAICICRLMQLPSPPSAQHDPALKIARQELDTTISLSLAACNGPRLHLGRSLAGQWNTARPRRTQMERARHDGM